MVLMKAEFRRALSGRTRAGLAILLVLVVAQAPATAARQAPGPVAPQDVNRNAQRMVDEGRQIFRFDTFGSEAFWGDALKLHQAIAGDANGGVGPGVSPKTALEV